MTTADDTLRSRQIQAELDMIGQGVERYRRALTYTDDLGNVHQKPASEQLPGVRIIQAWLLPVSEAIAKHVKEARDNNPRRHAVVIANLEALDPDALAFIALKQIVDRVSRNIGTISGLAASIGRVVIEEVQHNALKVEDRYSYKFWTEQIKASPDKKTRQRARAKLRKLFAPVGWVQWGDRAAIGLALIRHVLENTNIVEEFKRPNRRGHLESCLTLTDEFCKLFEETHAYAEVLWPVFLPMIVKPAPWTDVTDGGYVAKLARRIPFMRGTRKEYLEELNNNPAQLSTVFTALNALQDTPWRINRRVLETMQAALKGSGPAYALPPAEKDPLPPEPAGLLGPDEYSRHVRLCNLIRERNLVNRSRRFTLLRQAGLAAKYAEEEAFYFVYNLDWRGRVYPLTTDLTPQGSDTSKSLLQFARGEPLGTQTAADWLAVHGANCYGEVDKRPFPERVQWVKRHEDLIREAAADPLGESCRWWSKADSPWLFLAWCFEWVEYLEQGLSFVSHLPVSLDGSCNGLQNFAAMLRHRETAEAVNLVPLDAPADIYQKVADKVSVYVDRLANSTDAPVELLMNRISVLNAKYFADGKKKRKKKTPKKQQEEAPKGVFLIDTLESDNEVFGDNPDDPVNQPDMDTQTKQELGELWNVVAAKWLAGSVTRKLVKRPVMTYPYSVTAYGMKEQLQETLVEMTGDGKVAVPLDNVAHVAAMLKDAVYAAVSETVVAAAEAMRWLQEAASVVVAENLPVRWTSPAGLPVLQDYRKTVLTRIETNIGSTTLQKERKQLWIGEYTDNIDPVKQRAGIAPNFVHSCDASHMMLTVGDCLRQGLTSFMMIHDSYGTHAAQVDRLARTLRERFVYQYDGNVLEDFRNQLLVQVSPEIGERIPPVPAQGDLDLSEVMGADYFFA